jgi:N-acetylglucosaminyldiphosphoundecaprenol N-acetyl-beta-D-mannosaminyltransferase
MRRLCFQLENCSKRRAFMRINVLGVGFDNLTMAEAVDAGMELLDTPGCDYVVTPNPEIVEICRTNPEARRAVNGASLVLPDGIGVIQGAALLKTPLKEKTPGIAFAGHLMEKLSLTGKSLYLLGAKPGVAEEAGRRLGEKYPGLVITGCHDGYFQDSQAITKEIKNSGADCVFVCLGAPKQELWMAQYGKDTGAKLLCGLGGSLDVFAGKVNRAPEFWSNHGLEWLYRLGKEPRRIGRVMKLPLFLVHVAQERGKGK